MFQVCTLERIPYIFLCNDAIDIYIILTESHDQGLSNKPIYILRNTLVNEIHVEQSKCPKHLKHFWGHCTCDYAVINMHSENKKGFFGACVEHPQVSMYHLKSKVSECTWKSIVPAPSGLF